MLLNSLIFLLLSNSITSRRDKSILYSRIAITILLISAFIAYDNLSLLFLAKGIGIFAGLFHVTATTNTFHVFIFLVTGVILLLTSFYPRKVWLKDYSSPNKYTLKSGISHFSFAIGIFCVTIIIPDTIPSYSFYSLQDGIHYIEEWINRVKPIHPFLNHTYNQFTSMSYHEINIIRLVCNIPSYITGFTRDIGFPYTDHLLELHSNLDIWHSIHKFLSLLAVSLTLIIGVNIHKLINFISRNLNAFNTFMEWMINKCSSYYDPVRGNYKSNTNKETSKNKSNTDQSQNKESNKRKRSNSGSGGDKDSNKNRKNTYANTLRVVLTVGDLIIILRFVRDRLIQIRTTDQNIPTYYGNTGTITMNNVTQFMVRNPYMNVTISDGSVIQLGFLLSDLALSILWDYTWTLSNTIQESVHRINSGNINFSDAQWWNRLFFFDSFDSLMTNSFNNYVEANQPSRTARWNPTNPRSRIDINIIIEVLETLDPLIRLL